MENISNDLGHSNSAPSYYTHLLNTSIPDEFLFHYLHPVTEFRYTNQQDEERNYPVQEHHSHIQLPPIVLSSSTSSSSSSSTTSTTNLLDLSAAPKRTKGRRALPYAANLVNLNFGRAKPGRTTEGNNNSNSNTSTYASKEKRAPKVTTTSSTNSSSSNNSGSEIGMYECDEKGCKKAFTRRYNLKSHKRTHTMERPYSCSVCPKRFARVHDRNRHAKLHLGIKSYVCQQCRKAFARQDSLNRHLKLPFMKHLVCQERHQMKEEEQ